MQAIQTKTLQVTNTKGLRVKASCEAGNITLSWEYGVDMEENHVLAARALMDKLGWDYMLSSGQHGDNFYHIPMMDTMAKSYYTGDTDYKGTRKYRPAEIERAMGGISENGHATLKIESDSKSTRYLNIKRNEVGALLALFNQNDVK